MAYNFDADMLAVQRIPGISEMLDELCRCTGMGFAAVARVTADRWVACQLVDRIEFGMSPGDELEINTTICNEIRQSGKGVFIDHVGADADWRTHHTPALYGFESYVSVPIVLGDGSFFGTLCAIDPAPRVRPLANVAAQVEAMSARIGEALDRMRSSDTAIAYGGASR